jgi:tRNA(fMet)-specific endonuclease VapC
LFLLDTNTVISVLNERRPEVAIRLDAEFAAGTPILLSAIVLYELRYGVAKSQRRERSETVLADFLLAPVVHVAFESEDAEHAGDVRAYLARQGTPIGPYDLLIAAQARRIGAILVTANQREFQRVPGLTLENWAAAN